MDRARMANSMAGDMAALAKKYLKKIYYKERLETINKVVSTFLAIWLVCFMDKSTTVTCLATLAVLVINVVLYGMN